MMSHLLFPTVIVKGISSEELSYHEAESYVSHHKISKHQCKCLGSIHNLNSQVSSPFCKG